MKPLQPAIRKREEKWSESYKNRKIDFLSSLPAEDFVITVEDGNVYSKSGYVTRTVSSMQVDVAEIKDCKCGCTAKPPLRPVPIMKKASPTGHHTNITTG